MSERETDIRSFSYASIRSVGNPMLQGNPRTPEPHYEFDCEASDQEGPFWEPSNIEDELKAHISRSEILGISKDSIR